MTNNLFNKVLIIGVGLIGSSIARAIKEYSVSSNIYGIDKSEKVIAKCKQLDLLDDIKKNIDEFSFKFDLIILIKFLLP